MHRAAVIVVTGASGVGKTTAVAALHARNRLQLECFHFDDIGVPSSEEMEREFGGGERWQAYATEQWLLRLSKQPGLPAVSVLDGQTRPSFLRAALERVPPIELRIVLLDCSVDVRAARLVARGHSELANHRMDSWSAYLRGQADALGLPVIDTSQLSVEQIADELESHVARLRLET